MAVRLKNASESSNIARDVGTVVFEGHLRYPSDAGGWQLGDLDEYLARCHDRKLVLILAPIGEIDPATVVCGICGFAMNQVGECPRRKFEIAKRAREMMDTGAERDVVDQVADWLKQKARPRSSSAEG